MPEPAAAPMSDTLPTLDALLTTLAQTWAQTGQALQADADRVRAARAVWPPLHRLARLAGPAVPDPQGIGRLPMLMPFAAPRLAALQLAFDCALEHGAAGWQLRLLAPVRRLRRRTTQHRLEIELRHEGGEVRLDGLLWKRFALAPVAPDPAA